MISRAGFLSRFSGLLGLGFLPWVPSFRLNEPEGFTPDVGKLTFRDVEIELCLVRPNGQVLHRERFPVYGMDTVFTLEWTNYGNAVPVAGTYGRFRDVNMTLLEDRYGPRIASILRALWEDWRFSRFNRTVVVRQGETLTVTVPLVDFVLVR